MTRIRRTSAVLVLTLAACTSGRANLDPASIRRPAAESLTEAEVASIAAVANTAMIRGGQIGVQRGTTNSVRTFGELLVEDYSALNADLAGALERAGVSPSQHRVASRVILEEPAIVAALEDASGADFDAIYLRRQHQMARWYLAMLDHAMLPSVTSGPLRRHLAAVRSTTAAHLAAAEQATAGP